jgi:hypothetical protein
MNSYNSIVREVTRDWFRSKCGLPCSVVVRDCFPIPGLPHPERDARWCVFLTHAARRYVPNGPHACDGGHYEPDDGFLGEYDTLREAKQAAVNFRRLMHRTWDRLAAEAATPALQ